MDLPLVYYNKDDYIETATGNKLHRTSPGRDALICGTQNIVLNGKNILHKDVILRGDLSQIRIGKFCIVGQRTIIRASQKHFSKGVTMFPVHMGDHVMVEDDCIISAAQVCSFVHVGKDVILGPSCIIKECCRILPGSIIAPDSVFPPYSTIAGNPARVVGKEPECTVDLMTEATMQYYENFIPSCNKGASFA